jgi:hypothetical protein
MIEESDKSDARRDLAAHQTTNLSGSIPRNRPTRPQPQPTASRNPYNVLWASYLSGLVSARPTTCPAAAWFRRSRRRRRADEPHRAAPLIDKVDNTDGIPRSAGSGPKPDSAGARGQMADTSGQARRIL